MKYVNLIKEAFSELVLLSLSFVKNCFRIENVGLTILVLLLILSCII